MEAVVHYLAAVALAGAAGWLISTLGAGAIEHGVSAFSALIGGWRPDPWPRGVQEEDRDRPWGAPRQRRLIGRVAIEEDAFPVPVWAVRPKTRPR